MHAVPPGMHPLSPSISIPLACCWRCRHVKPAGLASFNRTASQRAAGLGDKDISVESRVCHGAHRTWGGFNAQMPPSRVQARLHMAGDPLPSSIAIALVFSSSSLSLSLLFIQIIPAYELRSIRTSTENICFLLLKDRHLHCVRVETRKPSIYSNRATRSIYLVILLPLHI